VSHLRTVLVTGGSRGIGRAVALAFAAAGHRVAITARTEAGLRAVSDEILRIARQGLGVVCDVADPAAVSKAVADVAAALGPIDVLVNNAGFAESARLADTSLDLWQRTLDVNLTGTFACTAAVLPGMMDRGWGRIVNIASTAGRKGYAYATADCAAKHGVVGLTRALALETATRGITVNAICPGFVDTDMTATSVARIAGRTGRSPEDARAALEAMSPQRRLMTVDEVAAAAVFLASDAARGINGQALTIDGGEVTS
jgi:NAD(P)-dependent dehydrogenase (short-subunit alcohol dehydrogenase family)